MLLHLFYCVVWFWFIFDLDSKSILKWLWKQIEMRKEKKKEKETLPVVGGLDAYPSRPAPSSLAVGPSEPSSLPPFLSRVRVGRPRSRSGRALSPLLP
jgi:hypothetical protein